MLLKRWGFFSSTYSFFWMEGLKKLSDTFPYMVLHDAKGNISFKGLPFFRETERKSKQKKLACESSYHLPGIFLYRIHSFPGMEAGEQMHVMQGSSRQDTWNPWNSPSSQESGAGLCNTAGCMQLCSGRAKRRQRTKQEMSHVHPATRGWRWHCCKVPSDQDFFSVLDMNKGIRMASFRELTLSDKRPWGLVSHCLIKVQEAVNQGLLGTCVGDIILLEDKPVKSFSWWKVTFNCSFAFLLFLLFICPFNFVNVSYYKNITAQRYKPSTLQPWS